MHHRMVRPPKPADGMDGQHNCSRDRAPVHHWFGESTSEDSSEEENESTANWSTIDREKKSKEKRKIAKERKSRKAAQVAMKVRRMASLGPISDQEIEQQWKITKDYEVAKVWAVKVHLAEFYDYNQDELDGLNILETKRTNRDEVIYIAAESEQDIRDIYSRKAEHKVDETVEKSYIPPQYFEWFSMLNKLCSERRAADQNLKTQIRFGENDLNILMKRKGEDEPYRVVDFEYFTKETSVPQFDMTIKWKIQQDRPPRRRVNLPSRPAVRKDGGKFQPHKSRWQDS